MVRKVWANHSPGLAVPNLTSGECVLWLCRAAVEVDRSFIVSARPRSDCRATDSVLGRVRTSLSRAAPQIFLPLSNKARIENEDPAAVPTTAHDGGFKA